MSKTPSRPPLVVALPEFGAEYEHFKGHHYVVTGFSDDDAGNRIVGYCELIGSVVLFDEPWKRPLLEFIEDVETSPGVWVPRFKKILL